MLKKRLFSTFFVLLREIGTLETFFSCKCEENAFCTAVLNGKSDLPGDGKG